MATTVIEGAQELLVETVSALSTSGVADYIVIGGWCPYLRNTSDLKHPGTLDVDILFKDGFKEGALATAIEAFRKLGFVASAKHPFQLLLPKTIGNEQLIYNVDLLHPRMNDLDKGMFVDHLDLDLPLDTKGTRVKKMRSIVQPNSFVLFEENLFSKYSFSGMEFNLVDFTGMFITKLDSCQKQKRERDSFDIYVAFKSGLVDLPKLKDIQARNEKVAESLRKFEQFLDKAPNEFDRNATEFMSSPEVPPSEFIREVLRAET